MVVLQFHLGLSNFAWLRIRSALRLPGAGLSPAFLYRRSSRLSQGTANPFRVTLMVRPLLLAEPGPGDAPCTTWALAVFFPPSLPSGGSALWQVRFPFCPGPKTSPVLPATPAFRPAGFYVTGDSNYSCGGFMSKPNLPKLSTESEQPHHQKFLSA